MPLRVIHLPATGCSVMADAITDHRTRRPTVHYRFPIHSRYPFSARIMDYSSIHLRIRLNAPTRDNEVIALRAVGQ
jgi:hypothetical protein